MKKHYFTFGSCVSVNSLVSSSEDSNYKKKLKELFNTAVFENYFKWKYFEESNKLEQTEKAVKWLLNNGIKLRGHTMLWQSYKFGVPMPKDIEIAARSGDPGQRDYIKKRVKNHIQQIGTQYRGIVDDWDVVNEQVTEHELTKVLTPETPVVNSPLLVDWFKTADKAVPGASLYINDFHILVGDFKQHKSNYEKIIKYLVDQKAPLSGIGFQCHYHGKELTRTPDQLKRTLDRFGKYNLPILITEYDTFGGGWGQTQEEKEKNEAEFLESFLISIFSHPKVIGFMIWGFWDGRHWAKNAPFFRADWTPKPALKVYQDLVFKKWWTNAEALTNDNGTCTINVFYGTYEMTLEYNGKPHSFRFEFAPGITDVAFTIKDR